MSRPAPYAFDDLVEEVRQFRDERDWERFHDPKSLLLALVGEVGELAELFQWVPAAEARERFSSGRSHARAEEEMSDVLIYLIGIANVLGVDLVDAARRKVADSRARFPSAEVHGVAPTKEPS